MAARKGKKEKQTNKTPEVVPVEEHLKEKELIPGKGFYESHWFRIQDKEAVDSFISSLVNEIFEASFIEGHHKSCSVLSLPYSVQWAKQRMIEIIECHFLQHDTGQLDMDDNIWIEDIDEPLPAPIDSWARGMMPIESEDSTIKDEETERQESSSPIKDSPPLEITTNVQEETDTEKNNKESESLKQLFSQPKGRRKRKQVMKVIESLPSSETQLEPQLNTDSHTSTLQSHTPPTPSMFLSVPPMVNTPYDPIPLPTNKRSDLVTDKHGIVKYSRKIDPKKFPSPSIKPHVKVHQSQRTETLPARRQTTQYGGNKSDHTRHHMRWSNNTTNTHLPLVNKTGGGLQRVDSSRFPRRPVLPFIVDLMDPLPGVTVTAQDRSISTTSGHLRHSTKLQRSNNLKPIKPQQVLGETREDISKRNSLIIRDRKVAKI